MTEREPPSPLELLKTSEPIPLTPTAEAARRQRVVSRIDVLRANLHAEQQSVTAGPFAKVQSLAARSMMASRSLLTSRSKWALAAAPLAAGLALFVHTLAKPPLLSVEEGELLIQSAASSQELGREESWDEADEVFLSTRSHEAAIVLPSRTRVVLAPQTRAQLRRRPAAADLEPRTTASEEHIEAIRLEQGAVRLSGAHSGEASFSVTTSHTLVQIRGTTFAITVERPSSQSERTHVVVQSGEASVWNAGREHHVTAGREWSSPESASTATQVPTQQPPTLSGSDAGSVPTLNVASEAKSKVSDLTQQNQLFESGQAAKRAGSFDLALKRFANLIRRFPASEQAHNARVEQFRLLRSLGRNDAARRSAQAYLRAYPRGFAAREAAELVAKQ